MFVMKELEAEECDFSFFSRSFSLRVPIGGWSGAWGGKVELSTLYEAMIRHNFRLNGVLENHNKGNCCRYTKLNFPVISRVAIES